MRTVAVAVLLVACHARNPAFCPAGEDPFGECVVSDAPPACYGVAPFMICVAPPAAPRTLGRIDTSTSVCDDVVMLGDRALCVVKGTDVDVVQRIRVSGDKPLVILASNALTVDTNGFIDAAGAATVAGPGADVACDAGATAGASSGTTGGGGGGGSFGSRGGSGGTGGGGAMAGTPGMPIVNLTVLQGGCSGGDGGEGGTAGSRGGGGPAGGGVYLVAGQTLTIRGSVSVAGAGGRGGGPSKGGGGGGGSGGMIVLYAPIAVGEATAQIFANGGGGGGGAAGSSPGMDGATSIMPFAVPTGGLGQGDGGTGAFLMTAAQPGMTSSDGGGGGGGGGGLIYILSGDFSMARVSPPPG